MLASLIVEVDLHDLGYHSSQVVMVEFGEFFLDFRNPEVVYCTLRLIWLPPLIVLVSIATIFVLVVLKFACS